MRTAQDTRNSTDPTDHSIANLRGFTISGANKMKQIAKHASAPMLQPAKMSIRSHRVKVNQPSSSSLLVGAGNGAADASCEGSWTYPPLPKGYRDLNLDRIGLDEGFVPAGVSGSRRDQPREFIDSRNVLDVIFPCQE